MAVAYGIGKVKSLNNLRPHAPFSRQEKRVSVNLLPSINKEVIFVEEVQNSEKLPILSFTIPQKKTPPPKKNYTLSKCKQETMQDLTTAKCHNPVLKCSIKSKVPRS